MVVMRVVRGVWALPVIEVKGIRRNLGLFIYHSLTDINLRTRDIELSPIERSRLCKTRDSVFGNRIGARERSGDVCGERAVIDYPAYLYHKSAT